MKRSISLKDVEEDLREAFKASLKEFLEKPRDPSEEEDDTGAKIPVIMYYLEQVAFKNRF